MLTFRTVAILMLAVLCVLNSYYQSPVPPFVDIFSLQNQGLRFYCYPGPKSIVVMLLSYNRHADALGSPFAPLPDLCHLTLSLQIPFLQALYLQPFRTAASAL